MKKTLKKIHNILSEKIAVNIHKNSSNFIAVYMHKIYASADDIKPINGSFNEGITLKQFEEFLHYFSSRNFTFVTDKEIKNLQNNPKQKSIFISFDDGYYNNLQIIPLLEKYNAKVTFYITTENCKTQNAFWWDILARENANELVKEKTQKENQLLYTMSHQQIESYIIDKYGQHVFDCTNNEYMRPMTITELQNIAKNEHISIGNHTTHHQNLTLLDKEAIIQCISDATNFIEEITKTEVCSIAYPYGFYSKKIQDIISEKSNLSVGVTTETNKETIQNINMLEINRHQLSGYFNISDQCRKFHYDYSFIQGLKKLIHLNGLLY